MKRKLNAATYKRSMQPAFTDSDNLPHTMTDLCSFDMAALSILDLLPPKPGGQAGAKIAPLSYKGADLKLIIWVSCAACSCALSRIDL